MPFIIIKGVINKKLDFNEYKDEIERYFMSERISDFSSYVNKCLIFNFNFRDLLTDEKLRSRLEYNLFSKLKFRTEFGNNVLHIKYTNFKQKGKSKNAEEYQKILNERIQMFCSGLSEEDESKLLMERNYNGWTPIFTAAFYGKIDVVKKITSSNGEQNMIKDYFNNDFSFYLKPEEMKSRINKKK